jgi:hypothetical protein
MTNTVNALTDFGGINTAYEDYGRALADAAADDDRNTPPVNAFVSPWTGLVNAYGAIGRAAEAGQWIPQADFNTLAQTLTAMKNALNSVGISM